METSNLKSKLRHGARMMLVGILAGANLVTIMLMWASCLSTCLSPALHPRLTQAGLLFPFFLGLDIAFIITWLFVSRRWVALPLLGMAACWSYIRDYCPVNFGKEQEDSGILVLSYNVAGLTAKPMDVFDGYKAVDYIANSGADLILLQEFPAGGLTYNLLSHKSDSLDYHMKNALGMCIISRWPFVGDMAYQTSGAFGNGTFAWQIDMDGDTILVINNHLQSNRISTEDKAVYSDAIDTIDKDKIKDSGKRLLSRLTEAAAKREAQTDSLCRLISRHAGQSIICAGDMNDTPISYTCQRLSDLLKSAYRESGNGPGISFTGKGFPVRIDHIFVSDDWTTSSTHIDNTILASDHRPILTRLHK